MATGPHPSIASASQTSLPDPPSLLPACLTDESIPSLLARNPEFHAFATGALVFFSSPLPPSPSSYALAMKAPSPELQERILLVQRAAHDTMPHLWEAPGGACDPTDENIVAGLARELREETGLRMKRARLVEPDSGAYSFRSKLGKVICKFNFEVDVFRRTGYGHDTVEEGGKVDTSRDAPPVVTLDPNEHQNFVWATEEQCREGRWRPTRKGDTSDGPGEVVELHFTVPAQRDVILEAFEARRRRNGNEERRG